MQAEELEYVGFWARVGASLIDSLLIGVIIWPILTALYGKAYWTGDQLVHGPMDFLLSWVFPAIAVIIFWVMKQTTPGKMVVSARLVDAKTGERPSASQCALRYLAYFISMLPLFLGFLWVGFDGRKQGWHDKVAGTVVVRPKGRGPRSVSFGG